jgi:dTDP-4-dehydrorhamnose reductase
MKVALTGSEGMFGHAVMKIFSDIEVVPFAYKNLDVTDLGGVRQKISDLKPDFLIHAAAYTNVDACETDADAAYRVNGLGARNVAIACEEIRCPVVYISSDYVFDGTKGSPYNEWDMPNPVNLYGLSKLMGEQFVSAHTTRFYIVRTSWLYGPNGNNFVDTIARLLSEKDSLQVVNDQFGCPTFTEDLARTVRQLLGKGYGIYHATNSGICSWYDFAVRIAEIKGLQKSIAPVSTAQFPRPAKRPPFSALNTTMLRLEGIDGSRRWEDALGEYLSEC